jgi:hypothetical protein
MTGSMIGWPHFLQSSVAKGGKLPEMNVLALQRPHATIFKALLPVVESPITALIYHPFPINCNCNVVFRFKKTRACDEVEEASRLFSRDERRRDAAATL